MVAKKANERRRDLKMRLLEGTPLANKIQDEIRDTIKKTHARPPKLVAILTTENPASKTYVTRKASACKDVGIESTVLQLAPKDATEIISLINQLNSDNGCDGILLQLPLPSGISSLDIISKIDPSKDVDGFHPINAGKLIQGDFSGFIPCTPLGIKTLLEFYQIPISGKHVVILGRSNIVGKPLASLLMQNAQDLNATVTVAHSKTERLAEICKTADILVAAIGSPKFVKSSMVKPGVVVIDVGVNRIEDPSSEKGFRLVGDVDFNEVSPLASAITPVPKGVGPMTIAMLLQNTVKSWKSCLGL